MSNSAAPAVTAIAEQVRKECGIDTNIYFRSLHDGSMSLDGFRRSQEQFFFCVAFFSRPMMALVGRIHNPSSRLEILRNVVEEHGQFEESAFHQHTFESFLRTIGSDVQELEDQRRQWPEVRAFNSSLIGTCLLDELEVGIACMGIIEYCFVSISTRIAQEVVQRDWLREQDLVHYRIHADIDVRHAQDFFELLEDSWTKGKRRVWIEQGLRLGAYIFDRLYSSLHASALKQVAMTD